jgi:hypothetical protein
MPLKIYENKRGGSLKCRAAGALLLLAVAAMGANQDLKPETLWNTSDRVVFRALQEFVTGWKGEPETEFVSLKQSPEGSLQFAVLSPRFKETVHFGPHRLGIEEDGFRVAFELDTIAGIEEDVFSLQRNGRYSRIVLLDQVFHSNESQILRIVMWARLKGNTQFTELRYYPTVVGVVRVRMTVYDVPEKRKTLADLRKLLQSRYGQYEGICGRVYGYVSKI